MIFGHPDIYRDSPNQRHILINHRVETCSNSQNFKDTFSEFTLFMENFNSFRVEIPRDINSPPLPRGAIDIQPFAIGSVWAGFFEKLFWKVLTRVGNLSFPLSHLASLRRRSPYEPILYKSTAIQYKCVFGYGCG